MNKNLVVTVLIAIIAAGAGFGGGMYYQRTRIRTTAGNGNLFVQNGRGGNRQFPGGSGSPRAGGAVTGEITAVDDKSITVKLSDGSSKIILLTDSTTYRSSSDAKKTDLAVGKTVAAFGAANQDGSTTATAVELNPIQRMLTK